MITCSVCSYISYISAGCLVTSGFVVYAYFWLLYICHLAINIFYPLKSAKFFNSRTIYIMELLLVFVIGTTPSIVSAGLSNYEILLFPPTQCGNNDAIGFYEVILPTMISITICGILMLLILYKIHVVSMHMKTSLIGTIVFIYCIYLNANYSYIYICIQVYSYS